METIDKSDIDSDDDDIDYGDLQEFSLNTSHETVTRDQGEERLQKTSYIRDDIEESGSEALTDFVIPRNDEDSDDEDDGLAHIDDTKDNINISISDGDDEDIDYGDLQEFSLKTSHETTTRDERDDDDSDHDDDGMVHVDGTKQSNIDSDDQGSKETVGVSDPDMQNETCNENNTLSNHCDVANVKTEPCDIDSDTGKPVLHEGNTPSYMASDTLESAIHDRKTVLRDCFVKQEYEELNEMNTLQEGFTLQADTVYVCILCKKTFPSLVEYLDHQYICQMVATTAVKHEPNEKVQIKEEPCSSEPTGISKNVQLSVDSDQGEQVDLGNCPTSPGTSRGGDDSGSGPPIKRRELQRLAQFDSTPGLSRSTRLRGSMQETKKGANKCTLCQQQFESYQQLGEHMATVHVELEHDLDPDQIRMADDNNTALTVDKHHERLNLDCDHEHLRVEERTRQNAGSKPLDRKSQQDKQYKRASGENREIEDSKTPERATNHVSGIVCKKAKFAQSATPRVTKCFFYDCQETFTSKNEFKAHLKKEFHTQNEKIKKHGRFNDKIGVETLGNHLKDLGFNIEVFSCNYSGCGQMFLDLAECQSHYDFHQTLVHVCDKESCGQSFTSKNALLSHVIVDHLEMKKKTFAESFKKPSHVCVIESCDQAFTSKFDLKSHIIVDHPETLASAQKIKVSEIMSINVRVQLKRKRKISETVSSNVRDKLKRKLVSIRATDKA